MWLWFNRFILWKGLRNNYGARVKSSRKCLAKCNLNNFWLLLQENRYQPPPPSTYTEIHYYNHKYFQQERTSLEHFFATFIHKFFSFAVLTRSLYNLRKKYIYFLYILRHIQLRLSNCTKIINKHTNMNYIS